MGLDGIVWIGDVQYLISLGHADIHYTLRKHCI
jgi:hypothetical protein